jgi:hypothetical protein
LLSWPAVFEALGEGGQLGPLNGDGDRQDILRSVACANDLIGHHRPDDRLQRRAAALRWHQGRRPAPAQTLPIPDLDQGFETPEALIVGPGVEEPLRRFRRRPQIRPGNRHVDWGERHPPAAARSLGHGDGQAIGRDRRLPYFIPFRFRRFLLSAKPLARGGIGDAPKGGNPIPPFRSRTSGIDPPVIRVDPPQKTAIRV